MRLAAPIAIVLLAAAVMAGCGGSSEQGSSSGGSTAAPPTKSTGPAGASAQSCPIEANGTEALRATGVSCGKAQRLVAAWNRSESCAPPAGASRSSCDVDGYRCLSAATDRGLAVSCSQSGRSIAFVVRR
ncbi:MAG TPA: hypothetical protein VGC49_08280 [Solirubrobacterales bacterium]|jgi:hypothetical protein